MKFIAVALILTSIATLAVGQTNDTCDALLNMNQCISINKENQSICDTNPAETNRGLCKCRIQYSLIDCYAQCPNSPTAQGEKQIAESQKQILCASYPLTQIFATPTGATPTLTSTPSSSSAGSNPSTGSPVNPINNTNSAARNLAGGSLAIAGLFAVLAL